MVLQGQNLQPNRYAIIPRTLTLLMRDDRVLLMRYPGNRGAWAGKFNGIGGHIEAGEDPRSSALREVQEETGLSPEKLWLAGVVMIDTGSSPGVGLYVFLGQAPRIEPVKSLEGELEWVPLTALDSREVLPDLPALIDAAQQSRARGVPFSALTRFDPQGKPHVEFSGE